MRIKIGYQSQQHWSLNWEKARLAELDSWRLGPLNLEFASIESCTGLYVECCCGPKIGWDKPHTFLPPLIKSTEKFWTNSGICMQIALNILNMKNIFNQSIHHRIATNMCRPRLKISRTVLDLGTSAPKSGHGTLRHRFLWPARKRLKNTEFRIQNRLSKYSVFWVSNFCNRSFWQWPRWVHHCIDIPSSPPVLTYNTMSPAALCSIVCPPIIGHFQANQRSDLTPQT